MLSTSNEPIFANQGFARLCDRGVLQSYYEMRSQWVWNICIPLYTITLDRLRVLTEARQDGARQTR